MGHLACIQTLPFYHKAYHGCTDGKKLYQLNFLVGAKFRKYVGHSAHVTNVRFSHDMMRVISVGGGDHAIFQWRYLPDGSHDDADDADGGAYLESNSDDSDSEASDVDDLDSDIENVRQKARWVVLETPLCFRIWKSNYRKSVHWIARSENAPLFACLYLNPCSLAEDLK